MSARRFLTRLSLLGLLLGAPVATASADPDPHPLLVWRHNITNETEAQRVRDYGVGPYADATTRLETELQASIELSRVDEAIRLMDTAAASEEAAARLFGTGYHVVKLNKPPRQVWDQYLDTPDGALARTGASLRLRTENGITQLNFKPPGGRRFPNGMAHRVEAGITLQAAELNGTAPSERLLNFFRNPRLEDNPLREIARLFPGRDVREFFNPAADLRQVRQMYEIQREDHGQWMKVSEMDIARVTARNPANPAEEMQVGRVELEGEHVNLQLSPAQQAAITAAGNVPPHSAQDAANQQFAETPDVVEIHRLSDVVSRYLTLRPAGQSKYAEARDFFASRAAQAGRTGLAARQAPGRTLRVPSTRPTIRQAPPATGGRGIQARTPRGPNGHR